ncbi:MAG: hypothetical protein JWN44_598 [Myxococcales bacterium]|nr:hypothetical protein [Myxococcales bacterium]
MVQIVWLTLLAVHTGAAAVWWWLMPGGFPGSSTEYWVNEVAPLVVIALMLTALLARGRFGEALLPPTLAAIPIFWMTFGVSSRIVFEESFRSSWQTAFIGGAILAGLWVNRFRWRVPAVWLVPLIVLPAAIAGWTLPGSQRSADPATVAAGAPFGAAPAGTSDHKMIRLTKDAQVHPAEGRLVVRRDKLVLNVQPLLSFTSRSPDRCWTALAPAELNVATTRTLVSKVHDGARWSLFYKDEDASVLDVGSRDGALQLEARSRLARPVFSHVNSFSELTIQGHQKLSVSFSPVPQTRIEVMPVTAAARFAYLDERATFHVMQASQRQRGPFTEIAAGPLKRGDPLILTIYDGDKPVFIVTLDDWAAQASTQLSPAAGSGIPVNAIELMRGGDPESSPALISLSLAATSIGRGTQSVGYAAGVYRNRISVRLPSP